MPFVLALDVSDKEYYIGKIRSLNDRIIPKAANILFNGQTTEIYLDAVKVSSFVIEKGKVRLIDEIEKPNFEVYLNSDSVSKVYKSKNSIEEALREYNNKEIKVKANGLTSKLKLFIAEKFSNSFVKEFQNQTSK